jgi:hypothetical protein
MWRRRSSAFGLLLGRDRPTEGKVVLLEMVAVAERIAHLHTGAGSWTAECSLFLVMLRALILRHGRSWCTAAQVQQGRVAPDHAMGRAS